MESFLTEEIERRKSSGGITTVCDSSSRCAETGGESIQPCDFSQLRSNRESES